eukprot:705856-Pelagomonas_calceolata.AAC.3
MELCPGNDLRQLISGMHGMFQMDADAGMSPVRLEMNRRCWYDADAAVAKKGCRHKVLKGAAGAGTKALLLQSPTLSLPLLNAHACHKDAASTIVLDGLRQKERHSNPESYVVLVAVGWICSVPITKCIWEQPSQPCRQRACRRPWMNWTLFLTYVLTSVHARPQHACFQSDVPILRQPCLQRQKLNKSLKTRIVQQTIREARNVPTIRASQECEVP